MDQTTEVREVSQALTERSTATTLDELRQRGRNRVRVIRAKDIAALLSEEALHAIGQLGKVTGELRAAKRALVALGAHNRKLTQQLIDAGEEPVAADPVDEEALDSGSSATHGGDATGTTELMMRMMSELAEMKASMTSGRGPAAPAGTADVGGMTAALEKISSNLNDRLEKFGRKMGISSAAEGSAVKYDSLFDDDETALESNMEDVQVKSKKGGGIAGNLERLKKLKGGE